MEIMCYASGGKARVQYVYFCAPETDEVAIFDDSLPNGAEVAKEETKMGGREIFRAIVLNSVEGPNLYLVRNVYSQD